MSNHQIGQNYLKKSLLIIEEWFIQGCKSCNREISMLENEYLAAKSASIQPRTSGIDILNSWSNPSPPYGSSASKCYLALSAIFLPRSPKSDLTRASEVLSRRCRKMASIWRLFRRSLDTRGWPKLWSTGMWQTRKKGIRNEDWTRWSIPQWRKGGPRRMPPLRNLTW